jgi:hypothetical protein
MGVSGMPVHEWFSWPRNGFVLRVSQHATAFRRGGAGADGFAAGLIAAVTVTAVIVALNVYLLTTS